MHVTDVRMLAVDRLAVGVDQNPGAREEEWTWTYSSRTFFPPETFWLCKVKHEKLSKQFLQGILNKKRLRAPHIETWLLVLLFFLKGIAITDSQENTKATYCSSVLFITRTVKS